MRLHHTVIKPGDSYAVPLGYLKNFVTVDKQGDMHVLFVESDGELNPKTDLVDVVSTLSKGITVTAPAK
jgi:hypothetical protein